MKRSPLRGIHRGLRGLPPVSRSAVTIGMFDGVHRAHQALIRETLKAARRLQSSAIALTFDPDPHSVFHPISAAAILPLEERCRRLLAEGLDAVVVIPFNRRFARIKAEDFVERILVRALSARACIAGHDFVFGNQRSGNVELLRRLGAPRGMEVIEVSARTSGSLLISSSAIRRCVREGRIGTAARLLGRPYALYGCVVRGAGRGRRLGFPTANVALEDQVLPPEGVYAARLHTARKSWDAVMHLGKRPTFDAGFACEVHAIGAQPVLLGKRVRIEVIRSLRRPRRFSSEQKLVGQVQRDILRAKKALAG